MNDSEVIARFRNLIAEFKQRDQCLVEALKIHDFHNPVFKAMGSLVIKIKEELARYDILKVDDPFLKKDLSAIRENKDFFTSNS
jgi:hypothetical protein